MIHRLLSLGHLKTYGISCVSVLLTVLPLGAARPNVEIVPLETITLPASLTGCGFDILAEPISNKEKMTTLLDRQGNLRLIVITGMRKTRLTNLSTGYSVDLNISGPVQISPQPDGTFVLNGEGRSTWLFAPELASGLPIAAYTTGRIVVQLDENLNTLRVLKAPRLVQDVCSLLAG